MSLIAFGASPVFEFCGSSDQNSCTMSPHSLAVLQQAAHVGCVPRGMVHVLKVNGPQEAMQTLIWCVGSDLAEDEDSSLEDIPEGVEDIEAPPAKRQQRQTGQLDADSQGQSAIAMPANYPEEWKKKFEEGYQQAAQSVPQVSPEEGRSGRLTPKAGPPPERGNDDTTADALPHADTHEMGGVSAQHVSHDEAVVDAQLERQEQQQTSKQPLGSANQDGALDNSALESQQSQSPFAAAGLGPELAPNPATIVNLSQLDPETLEDARGSEAVPIGFERAESEGSEHDFVTLGPDGVPTAGLMQAGMNEPSGALGAPSELSLQHTTYSGKVRFSSPASI